jgi:hypothetical protein
MQEESKISSSTSKRAAIDAEDNDEQTSGHGATSIRVNLAAAFP